MWKSVVGATAALVVAASSLAIAQQRFGGPGGPGGSGGPGGPGGPGMERGWRPSAEDRVAFAAARIAALKAGLKLTPDQEKNWPAFEAALNELVKLRADRAAALREQAGQREGRDDQGPANPFDRMQRRADTLSKYGAALKQLADAGSPLYLSLDDGQKHRFAFLSRMLRPHHWQMAERMRQHHGWQGRGDGGWQGRGDGGWQGRGDRGPGGSFERRRD